MNEINGAGRLPRINASEHSARGFACCTYCGVIVWRGPLPSLPDNAAFDIVHCHDVDVLEVQRILIGRPDRGKMSVIVPFVSTGGGAQGG